MPGINGQNAHKDKQRSRLASIDIGSHTARLLVVQRVGPPGLFEPLIRKRAYIRLAEDFNRQGNETISEAAIDRTLNVLDEFSAVAKTFDVDHTHAVTTGVVRKAANGRDFLDLIFNRTGIKARLVSGEEEGRLTCIGVLHALDVQGRPFIIFDLGGGTTEFIFGEKKRTQVKSIPLGAMILTQKYLASDPSEENAVKALMNDAERILQRAFPEQAQRVGNDAILVGTGGTVTTLAAMIHRIERKNITPAKMDGLILRRERLADLFARLKTMTIAEILNHYRLDRGRADVILAGCAAVMGILHFFQSLEITVSLSDLLEGILLASLDGEENG